MRHSAYFLFILLFALWSCEQNKDEKSDYLEVSEISLPTESPRGLAFDGEYLWYSDDLDRALYKISSDGDILETIYLASCHITGFDFYNDYIWGINDTTVLNDTTISHYPFSCIYKYTREGERLDSILVQSAVNSIKPELVGITLCNSKIYFSTNQGWSSSLNSINLENQNTVFLHFNYLSGLTVKNDTFYCVDKSYMNKSRVVSLDSAYRIIEENAIDLDFDATDLAYIGNELWICNREDKKLIKLINYR